MGQFSVDERARHNADDGTTVADGLGRDDAHQANIAAAINDPDSGSANVRASRAAPSADTGR